MEDSSVCKRGEERKRQTPRRGWAQANLGNEKRQSESHLEANVCEAPLTENAARYFSGQ